MKRLSMLTLLLSAAISAGAQATFTSNSSWTVPTGVTSVNIEVVGAGGSGIGNGGGGGGGGGYASGTFTVVPGTVHTITVGAGGSGVTTSISGLPIQATAGANGVWQTSPQVVGGGGAAGVGSGGTVNRTGGTGGGGYWTYFGGGGGGAAGSTGNGGNGGNSAAWPAPCPQLGGTGGLSGGAPGGNGGKGGGLTDPGCNSSDPAAGGSNYGGGGGGGNGVGAPGGVGASGFVSINWCPANTPMPTGTAMQSFCADDSATLADLVVTGTGIQWYAAATGGSPLPMTTLLVDGAHYFATQMVSGCESNSRLDIMAHVTAVTSTATLAASGLTINGTPVTGGTYRWIVCGTNTTVPNATTANLTPTANGSYALVVTLNGCSDTSSCVTVSKVGVGNEPGGTGIRIAPNPMTDVLTVQVTAQYVGESYRITDASGRVLKQGRLSSSANEISVADLPKGTYFLQAGSQADRSYQLIKK